MRNTPWSHTLTSFRKLIWDSWARVLWQSLERKCQRETSFVNKFFKSLCNCLLIYSLTYQMIHVISLMLILHRSETSSTICLASLPIDNKAAPNVEHKKIKPNKFRPRRLPADVFSRLSLVSFLRTLSRRVSYSLNEISTILSGKRFLLKIDWIKLNTF